MECASVEDDSLGRPLHQLRFDAAVKVIQSLPPGGSFQPSNDMMLRFYSYYKQATMGPCSIPRPGFWDPVGKAKWDAWNALEQMSQEDAMTAYVDEMKLILEGMPVTDEVENLLKVLGPFYELVDSRQRKVNDVSDLSAARLTMFARQLEGFGNVMSSLGTAMPSKSVTKSIIRTMEMNGSLETRPRKPAPPNNNLLALRQNGEDTQDDEDEEDEEDEEEEDDEEEEVAIKEMGEVKKDRKAAASQPKTGPARKSNMPVSNGKMGNGVGMAHLTNGTHCSKSALNSDESEEGVVDTGLPPDLQLNGHHTDTRAEVSAPHHLASDSDSEVYCDSMDQFGLEEGSEERVNSSRGLDEDDECHSHVSSGEDPQALQEDPQALEEDPHALEEDPGSEGPPEGLRCGGEDGESGGASSERHRLSSNRPDSSLVRRGRGSRSSVLGPGEQGPRQGGAGDGERWGGAGAPGGRSLNEQIVAALARLQEDMQSVLERLHTLEARSLALPPNYTSTPAKKSSKKPSWWPFDVSPSTVAFAVVWPFVVQWLIRLYLQRRRRRIN